MKIRFLGTSAGIATLRSFNTSILMEADADALLIDCGEPVSATLIRLGVPPDLIGTLAVTHLHPDHTGGFTQLIQTFQILRRSRPLTVWMPSEGIETFNTLLNTVYLYRSVLPFELNIVPVRTGHPVKCGSFRLEFFANEHLACCRGITGKAPVPAPCESFSIAAEAEKKRVVVSGDIRHAAELTAPLSAKTDLLISELVHFPPDELAALPGKLLPPEIIFTHCRNKSDGTPQDRENPVLAPFMEKIKFAEDCMEENL